ncbi:uncharacterized protein LOC104437027 isoform X2 [Eucalyptus grandis]|uniref:uncharacterized protein LOC104437027 isoform X2 n=1 Tax=Eucalyptus grandis TaxID=71139 RepID=UPI00192E9727|nr:uncharacterized protein LOC104437027 isoform X2 [Eucalyptus grandis]
MGKWPPWQPEETKKLHVKFRRLRLEGLDAFAERDGDEAKKEKEKRKEKGIFLEVKWRGPKQGLVQFPRTATRHRQVTTQRLLSGDAAFEWDEGELIEGTCGFGGSSAAWEVSFKVLCGDCAEPKPRLAVLGKVSLNLAEMASKMESAAEKKLPIALQIAGDTCEASLTVSVSFSEARSCSDVASAQVVVQGQNATAARSEREDGFFKIVNAVMKRPKKSQEARPGPGPGPSSDSSDGSPPRAGRADPAAGSDGRRELSPGPEPGSSTSSSEPVKQRGFLSWKRRRLSLKPTTRSKVEPLTVEDGPDGPDGRGRDVSNVPPSAGPEMKVAAEETSLEMDCQEDDCFWEEKELVSRDGQTKLRTNVSFASFDQRSEKACGESACSAVAAMIVDFLYSNQYNLPTRAQFNSLIKEGSEEWQRLCTNEAYLKRFPNKHFDLDTVFEAGMRPFTICHDKSFIGSFSPEKFEALKGFMSFDDIWAKIMMHEAEESGCGIYIVSWNDHFFVLMVEDHAYYVIDSLGERLFEGCDRAYILKFDEAAVLYRKAENGESCGSGKEEGEGKSEKKEDEWEEVMCAGRECCGEYIKRFLAAIQVQELEEDEKKGSASTLSLHQRLQVEFHYCCPNPSEPPAAEAVAAALPSANAF